MMNGTGWAQGLGGWPWMIPEIAIGVGIVLAIAWLVTAAFSGRQHSTSDRAAEILGSRLARGEITEAEYEQARRLVGIN